MRFAAAGSTRTHWRSFGASPDSLAAIAGKVLLLRRREGKGKGWDRGGREEK